jgi:hypothetical protein
MTRTFLPSLLILFVATLPAHAVGTTIINFESVPGVTPVNGFLNFTPVPANARLNTQLLSTYGVRFRSESPNPDYVALIQLGVGHAPSGSNGIGGIDTNNDIRYSVPTIISFFDPTSPNLPAVTDFVSIRADLFDDDNPLTLQAFGVNGNLLATDSALDVGGPVLSVQVPGIHSIRLIDVGSSVAWDDLTFAALQVVPEPGSIALGIFGALSFIPVRRRVLRR